MTDEQSKRAGEAARATDAAEDPRRRCDFCQEKHDVVVAGPTGAIICDGGATATVQIFAEKRRAKPA